MIYYYYICRVLRVCFQSLSSTLSHKDGWPIDGRSDFPEARDLLSIKEVGKLFYDNKHNHIVRDMNLTVN